MDYLPKLAKVRIERNYTQPEVCKKLKMKQEQLSRYETGKTKIPVKVLKELCLIYDISADYLLGLTENERSYK